MCAPLTIKYNSFALFHHEHLNMESLLEEFQMFEENYFL